MPPFSLPCFAANQPTHRVLPIVMLQLRGSKAIEAANERFDATMTNVVRWQEASPADADASSSSSDSVSGGKQLVSDTSIQVQLQVPGWFVLPTSAIERAGASSWEGGAGRGRVDVMQPGCCPAASCWQTASACSPLPASLLGCLGKPKHICPSSPFSWLWRRLLCDGQGA